LKSEPKNITESNSFSNSKSRRIWKNNEFLTLINATSFKEKTTEKSKTMNVKKVKFEE
jgi:hypothetical protein